MADDSVLAAWLAFIVPHHCYDELFIKFNLLNVPCLKIVISKLLGFAIICGSVTVKLPQILKIISGSSAEGISLPGVLLELTAITCTMAYSFAQSFPFSAWGEGLFLAIQTIIIGALVLFFNGSTAGACMLLSTYAVLLYILLSGFTPLAILGFLTFLNIPIVIAAKGLQAVKNYKNGSTGQLSSATVFLLFFGSMARIFTSVQETGDSLIIASFILATIANGLIAFQVVYYWNVTPKKEL